MFHHGAASTRCRGCSPLPSYSYSHFLAWHQQGEVILGFGVCLVGIRAFNVKKEGVSKVT